MKVKKLVSDKISLININYKKCLIICCILIFIGAVIFACIPKITKFLVNYLCVLKPGHFLRKKHEDKLPFTYKLYLWNVTNPNEIATGIEKPKLQEIGPYVFSLVHLVTFLNTTKLCSLSIKEFQNWRFAESGINNQYTQNIHTAHFRQSIQCNNC